MTLMLLHSMVSLEAIESLSDLNVLTPFGLALLLILLSSVVMYICRYRTHDDAIDSHLSPGLGLQRSLSAISAVSSADILRQNNSIYRFRKRDKLAFYGRKLYRQFRSFSSAQAAATAKRRIRRRLLRQPRETPLGVRAQRRPPPASIIEADRSTSASDGDLPEEIVMMLKNIRVFGHFETAFFLQLCRNVKTMHLAAGSYVFQPGDPDDSIYVLQSGRVAVYVRHFETSTDYEVKMIERGQSIISLLSIMDVLVGDPGVFKSVSALVVEDATLLKLSGEALSSFFEDYSESWLRAVQIIMLRLQRVTLTTLHDYLGLSAELTLPTLRESRKAVTLVQKPFREGSPMRSPSTSRGRKASNMLDYHQTAQSGTPPRVRHTSGVSIYQAQSTSQSSAQTAPSAPSTSLSRRTSVGDAEFHPKRMSRQGSDGRAHPSGHSGGSFRHRHRRFSGDPNAQNERQRHPSIETDEAVLRRARAHVAQYLGLPDESLLEGKLEVKSYPPNYVIMKQGDLNTSLVYVLSGSLDLLQRTVLDSSADELISAIVHTKELVGGLSVLTGEPSFWTVRTRSFARMIGLSRDAFYTIVSECPRVVLNVARSVLQRVSPFIRSIDFALDWEMIDAGRVLYEQNSPAESLYVVLSGRIRSIITRTDGVKEVQDEFGRGDLVGLVELLSNRQRSSSVMAVRYSELAKLPSGLMNYIKICYPQVLTRVISLLSQCILQPKRAAFSGVSNLNTIAVMAVSQDVPIFTFTLELCHALNSILPGALRLSSDVVLRQIGPHALDNVNENRLSSWLSQQEDSYSFVVYQCDYAFSAWTKRCVRQADCILVVALGDSAPTTSAVFNKQLDQLLTMRAQKKLVLLWREGTERPRKTAEWLDAQAWTSGHYHIRCPHRMFVRRSPVRIDEMYNRIFQLPADKFSDFSRLARTLTGNSIGLVLGGGGARGAAHIGILKAMREFGVPIDMVGGTSIGAFVGGLFCEKTDISYVAAKAKQWFGDMQSFWRKIWDLTYPAAAIFTGAGFNHTLKAIFRNRQVEDLWIPYFNVTTDITASQMRVHTSGEMWYTVRASMSIVCLVPPMPDVKDRHLQLDGCYTNNLPGPLWAYVRASMSLAGYMPPLCDNDDGHLLVDGGYVNNVPADVMRNDFAARTVIAIDVGGQDEKDYYDHGESLSGWWVLWQRWNPFRAKALKVLSMAEIQSKLAYVCCERHLESVKAQPYVRYVRPPIDRYQTLDFHLFDEIFEVGYKHGRSVLEVWSRTGQLQTLLNPFVDATTSAHPHVPYHGSVFLFPSSPVAAEHDSSAPPSTSRLQPEPGPSFTDLAALVSKIDRAPPVELVSDSSSDGDDSSDSEEDHPFDRRASQPGPSKLLGVREPGHDRIEEESSDSAKRKKSSAHGSSSNSGERASSV